MTQYGFDKTFILPRFELKIKFDEIILYYTDIKVWQYPKRYKLTL